MDIATKAGFVKKNQACERNIQEFKDGRSVWHAFQPLPEHSKEIFEDNKGHILQWPGSHNVHKSLPCVQNQFTSPTPR